MDVRPDSVRPGAPRQRPTAGERIAVNASYREAGDYREAATYPRAALSGAVEFEQAEILVRKGGPRGPFRCTSRRRSRGAIGDGQNR